MNAKWFIGLAVVAVVAVAAGWDTDPPPRRRRRDRRVDGAQHGAWVDGARRRERPHPLHALRRARALHLHEDGSRPRLERDLPVAVDAADRAWRRGRPRRRWLGTVALVPTAPARGHLPWPAALHLHRRLGQAGAAGNGFHDVGVWRAATAGSRAASPPAPDDAGVRLLDWRGGTVSADVADRAASRMDAETMRRLGYRTVDMLVDRLTGAARARWSAGRAPDMLCAAWRAGSGGPGGFDEILDGLERDMLPTSPASATPATWRSSPARGPGRARWAT